MSYFGDTGNNAVKQWNAASQQVLTLVSSGLNNPPASRSTRKAICI